MQPGLHLVAMAKAKDKGSKASNVPQRHIHSRVSFLYQAATLLSKAQTNDQKAPGSMIDDHHGKQASVDPRAENVHAAVLVENSKRADEGRGAQARRESPNREAPPGLSISHAPIARHLLSHLRGVSLKSQIRLSPAIKHSLCKRCDTLLVPGSTSTSMVENLSKGGTKPWADVLVIQCCICHAEKRFPVGARMQQKRGQRQKVAGKQPNVNDEGGVGE